MLETCRAAMIVNKSFVMIISLLTSGFLLCATYQLSDEEVRARGTKFDEEEKGRGSKDSGVGIHLGTTYSSVAVLKHPAPVGDFCFPWLEQCATLSNSDIIEVVKNERGSTTTPSCVAFTDSGVLIGQPAKDQAPLNSERTICGINRLIGKRFDDPDVQVYIKTLLYKVVSKENKPHVEVKFKNGETKFFSPEEICALILWKMKEIAEAYMGNEIKHAVVLVHPRFDYKEVSRSIQEAGKAVGLQVDWVRNSRSALALVRSLWAYKNSRGLVYNLGGSAFDVTLQDYGRGRSTNLIASRGDVHLGGQTFDTRVVDYFISLIKNKYNKDISNDITAVEKLRIKCEKAKISLSRMKRVTIKIDGIEEPLTRETFEDLNIDLFTKTIDLVRDVMNEGGIEKSQLDGIILVGGNSQIPKIQHMLKELLGREVLSGVNPDEAVAFAATRMARFFSGNLEDALDDVKVSNSLSLGIETIGGIMTHYIRVHRYLPLNVYRHVTTYYDGQATIRIKVFEGERSLTKYCHYLGTLEISNLPPAPRGEHIIKVTMEVALNWDIHVTAEHVASHNVKTMTIPAEQRYFTLKKLKEVFKEHYESYQDDIKERTQVKEAMSMILRRNHNMKFAVVNTYDFEDYFGYNTSFSNTTGLLKEIKASGFAASFTQNY